MRQQAVDSKQMSHKKHMLILKAVIYSGIILVMILVYFSMFDTRLNKGIFRFFDLTKSNDDSLSAKEEELLFQIAGQVGRELYSDKKIMVSVLRAKAYYRNKKIASEQSHFENLDSLNLDQAYEVEVTWVNEQNQSFYGRLLIYESGGSWEYLTE